MLWVLDASLNISMEPFRAFVGDMLRQGPAQRRLCGADRLYRRGRGGRFDLPLALEQMGVSNVAPGGGIPDTVRYAFWFGGAALFLAVLWTVLTTKEFSPEEMAAFEGAARRSRPIRCACSPRAGSAPAWSGSARARW
jgi:maltose/moltooligosaccharide transporter